VRKCHTKSPCWYFFLVGKLLLLFAGGDHLHNLRVHPARDDPHAHVVVLPAAADRRPAIGHPQGWRRVTFYHRHLRQAEFGSPHRHRETTAASGA
jgi:hypothetical protein